MSGFYYKDWREVFKWPRIGDRGTGEAGNPQGSFGRAGGRTTPSRKVQQEVEAEQQEAHKPVVVSKPEDDTQSVWHVGDLFMGERGRREDTFRVRSRHSTEPEAKAAGASRAKKLGTRHYHYNQPIENIGGEGIGGQSDEELN